jgi:hypothetical protein
MSNLRRAFLGLLLMSAVMTSVPALASAADYSAFVGCDDLSGNPVPAHTCSTEDFLGAFFESDADTEYEICVEFPDATVLCAEEQLAEAGVLYVNSITSDEPGDYFATWYVEGVEVGSWAFRLDSPPPPPPPPPAAAPAAVVPPAVVLGPSAECLKDQANVNRLKSRLHNADGRKLRARLRVKLKAARAAANNAC